MRNRYEQDNDFYGRRDYQHQGFGQDRDDERGWQGSLREHQGELSPRQHFGQEDRRYQGGQFSPDYSEQRRYQGGQFSPDYSEQRRYQGGQLHPDYSEQRRYQGGQLHPDYSDQRRYQGNMSGQEDRRYQGNMSGYEGRYDFGGQPGSDAWAHNIGPMGPTQGMSFKGRGPKGYKRTDQRIEEDINDRLMHQQHLDVSDVEVKVSNGEVTLTGTVCNRQLKHMVENVADAVAGVQEIHNQLRVKRQDQEMTGSKGWEDKSSAGRPAYGTTEPKNGTTEPKNEQRTARS